MADLHLSGGETLADDEARPTARPGGSRPWDRHVSMTATAATRGAFWEPQTVDEVQYPTRMARRRALEAAQVLDGWQPDPVLTPPLLERVGEELLRLFDGPSSAAELVESPERSHAPGEDAPSETVAVPDDDHAPVAPHALRESAGSTLGDPPVSWHRRGWRRRGRSSLTQPEEEPTSSARDADTHGERAPAAISTATPTATPAAAPAVVRQDDPVDDAAWFAGLKQMAREEEGVADPVTDAAPDPRAAASEATPRPPADVQQIVPASAPTSAGPMRRWVAVAVAALVVVSVGVVLAVRSGDGGPETAAAPSTTPQQAVVVALSLSEKAARAERPAKGKKSSTSRATQARAGDVTGLSLIAAGGGSAQQVLVPSRLLLDVPGAGRVPLVGSLLAGPQAPGEAIADALEVKVDTTWTLDSDALAALVDRVGGVVVDVDADVTQSPRVGSAVLVGAGPQQKLAGEQAAQFAQFLGADEPEAARLARQEQVLRAVFSALPDDPATIRAILADLPGAPHDGALDAVVRVVSATRLAASKNELASTVLPVKEIDAGGTVVSYGLDDAAADQLVDARLSGAKLPVAAVGYVRVLVQNGVGAPGLGDAARTKLLAAGLRYVAGGNLPGFGQKKTVVLLRDASATSRERGMAVATALGLGQSSLRINESAPTIADIVVVLGADFDASSR